MNIGQRIEHRQTQTLSPRLQHAVRLLQMSSLDFSAMVQDLLGKNPFLEASEAGDEEGTGGEDAPNVDLGPAEEMMPLAPDPDSVDDRELWRTESGGGLRRAEDGEISTLELTPTRLGLRDHLRSQINVLRIPERDRILACIVAESVDEDGYLRTPLEELAPLSGLLPSPNSAEMSIALKRVQSLDPPGVAARDVAECLRLQLDTISCERTRTLARRVVDECFDLLATRDSRELARRLHVTQADSDAVVQRLRQLDPRPGWRFEGSLAPYVVPDVLTSKHRGVWQVRLNPAVVPRVRMNQVYAELFRRHRSQEHTEMAEHLNEARWTLRNIEQRFSTILDVAQAIVRRQRHFLEFGPMAMKPLGLKEIADEVGVHESTVSRVTNNKFLATPSGVYELKRFFSRAIVSTNGSACCATAIRELIRDIIAAEPSGSPLSDAEITRLLDRQGLVVARRTVTKYRQMLKIEPADRRGQRAA